MRGVVRTLRKPLHKLGVDVVRYRPQYALGEYAYLTTLGIKTVIDAGAHDGGFARMIKKLLPEATVISFEPLHETFQELENSMRGVSGWRAFNCALGEEDARIEMHRSNFTQSSSLLPMADLHKQAFPESADASSEMVEVSRLDSVLDAAQLEPEILLKIDVQGYEDRVIRGGEKLVARARALIVEVSFQKLYEGQPLFDDVYGMLKQRGLLYMGNLYQLTSPVDGCVLQADALFMRQTEG